MSAVIRTSSRPISRTVAQQARSYSAGGNTLGADMIKAKEAVKHHAEGSTQLWRKITLYVALPSIAVAYLNAQNLLHEHEKHIEHVKEENGGDLPERIQYDFMNKRNKSYPWGNWTLFWNEKVNLPLPE